MRKCPPRSGWRDTTRLQLTGFLGPRRPIWWPPWPAASRMTSSCGWPPEQRGNPLYVTELLAPLARGSSLTDTGCILGEAEKQASGGTR